MAGLPRSEISFRRQGSSGLVWEDKLFSGELKQTKAKDEEDTDKAESIDPKPAMQRSRSNGNNAYRSMNITPALVDPPSPKASGCGICGLFGKPVATQPRKRRRNRKS
ncbi:unnamed protein product [Ilex paraguariensis]|uniref:MAPK kinase substrate protein n=1 Tax=Ilex paraguariensis TaxID=185542 RepID=A0ABC8RRM5_9AQUA